MVAKSVPQPFTYTRRKLDTESGLSYYGARYYDSQAERFLSEDPIGFRRKDTNMYRYVFNDWILEKLEISDSELKLNDLIKKIRGDKSFL